MVNSVLISNIIPLIFRLFSYKFSNQNQHSIKFYQNSLENMSWLREKMLSFQGCCSLRRKNDNDIIFGVRKLKKHKF